MAPLDLEKLLSDDAWIRRLARRLARDPDVADDLVQDAWVATLDARRETDAERPWLGGVVRNLWRGLRRSEARRREREDRVADARGESEPGPAELVEELTLRRELAAALLELDEPYRRTLWLRFFQDRSISSLAREEGVPVSTVHDRMKRGLARLRVRLDRTYGGDRNAWACTLLTLAQPVGLVSTVIGGIVMGTGSKLAASAVVVGGALFWALSGADEAKDQGAPPELVPAAEVASGQGALRTEQLAGQRESLVEAPEEAPTEQVALARHETGAALGGTVLAAAGSELPGITVGFVQSNGRRAGGATADTDAGGVFTLPRGENPATHVASFTAGWTNLVLGVVDPSPFEGLGERATVVVAPSADYAGTVVDENHQPIEGVHLRFQVRQSLFRKLGIARPFPPEIEAWEVLTGVDGSFSLPGLAGGDEVYLLAFKNGFEKQEVELSPSGDAAMVVQLATDTLEIALQGRVVDRQGRGVPDARVSAGSDIVTTDAAGKFTLPWRDEATGPYSQDEEGTWSRPFDSRTLRAVKVGFLPAELRLEDPDPDRMVLLRLGPEPLCLRGKVVDETGRGVAGAAVWAARLQDFGTRETASENSVAVFNETLEEQMVGGTDGCGVQTREDGTFELCGLLDKEYEFLVLDPESLTRGGPFTVHPGASEVEFVLRREPATQRVAGRVVDGRGQPISGVVVVPERDSMERGVREVPRAFASTRKIRTDEEGFFDLGELATVNTSLSLRHDVFFMRHVSLSNHDDPGDLHLVEPVLCDFEVNLGSEPELADRLKVLDQAGEELKLLVSHGVFLSMAREASLEEGLSGVMRVKETARTLILYRGDTEVLRRPLRLEPGEATVVRP